MKLGKRKILGRFTTTTLRLEQRCVQVLDHLDFPVCIEADERNRFDWLSVRFTLHLRTRSGYLIATFFTTLHRATPEIAKCVVASSQGVVAIPLCVGQRAIVAETFEQGFHTAFCVVRRALGTAIEENIKLDSYAPDVVFQARELFVRCRLILTDSVFVLCLCLLFRSEQSVIANCHGSSLGGRKAMCQYLFNRIFKILLGITGFRANPVKSCKSCHGKN